MALINTTTTGVLGSTFYADGSGDLTVQQNGVTVNKITSAPAFSAYRNGTQSFTANAWTKIHYNVENYDTANCYDNSTNYRFTPNVAGYYIFIVSINLNGSSNPTVSGTGLYKNGTSYRFGPVNYFTWTNQGSILGTYSAYMNGTTDYVEGVAYSSGTSPFVGSDSSQSIFEGYLVRSA